MPFAHVHTFLALAGIFIYLALVQFWFKKGFSLDWFASLILIAALATPQIIWQLSVSHSGHFSYWQFGWMKGQNENILIFWLRNMGLGLVFLFTNLWLVVKMYRKNNFYFHIYLPLVVLFVIANLYIFQPHVYDNMKLMLFSYFGIVFFASFTLLQWFKKTFSWRMLAIGSIVLLSLTGIISITREMYLVKWQFHTKEDLALAEQFKKIVPPEARVLTSDKHNHFVPTLTGRRIVMGYRGWLWTYGIDYRTVERDVMVMFSGGPATPQLLKKYGVSYVVIGPSEKTTFGAKGSYFNQKAKVVLNSPSYKVYDVRVLSGVR